MADEKEDENIARWLYINFGFSFYGSRPNDKSTGYISTKKKFIRTGSSEEINKKAGAELWDTGKYDILDYGGEDFNFTLNEKDKKIWREKARELKAQILKENPLAGLADDEVAKIEEYCLYAEDDVLHEKFKKELSRRQLLNKKD